MESKGVLIALLDFTGNRRVYREEPFQRRRHLSDLTERPLSKPDDIN